MRSHRTRNVSAIDRDCKVRNASPIAFADPQDGLRVNSDISGLHGECDRLLSVCSIEFASQ
jgi:hypothetical protein